MKVRIVLDVKDHDRYVIARYFRGTDGGKVRTRATRTQVRRFAEAALRRVVRDLVDDLDARGQSTARRLRRPSDVVAEAVAPPPERQMDLLVSK